MKKNVRRTTDYFIGITVILLSIYSFLGYLISTQLNYVILISSLSILIFIVLLEKRKDITRSQFIVVTLMILFILLQLLQAPYTLYPENSINTAVNRSFIFMIGIFMCIQRGWFRVAEKYILIFSLLHVIVTLIAFFIPSFYQAQIIPILPSEINTEIIKFWEKDVISGLTDQIGRNAFYISVSIAVIYAHIIHNQHSKTMIKIIMYTILFLCLLALMATGKRGHLLSSVISMVVLQVILAKFQGRNILLKAITIITTIIIGIYLLIILFPEAAAPFLRFIEREGGDQTSGRIELFILAFEMFKEKPMLGWGVGVYNNLYGIGTHNMYLQILSEHGLMGILLFILLLLFNLRMVLKKLKEFNNINNNDKRSLLFSLYIQMFFIIYGMTGNPVNDGFILIIYLMASSIPYTQHTKTDGNQNRLGEN